MCCLGFRGHDQEIGLGGLVDFGAGALGQPQPDRRHDQEAKGAKHGLASVRDDGKGITYPGDATNTFLDGSVGARETAGGST